MLRKTVLFLIFFLILLWGMQQSYTFFLRRNVNLKSSYVMSHRIDAEVLFLGPCEPLWMLDPAAFKQYTGLNAYNLSTVHANFGENAAMLHVYLKNNKAPQYLVVYATTESMDGTLNVFNTYNFPQLMDDPWLCKVIAEEDSSFYKYSSFPFMRFAYYSDYVNFNFVQGVKHFFNKRETPYFPDGFVPPHGVVWDNKFERFVHKYPKGRIFAWNPLEVKYLENIFSQAREHDIQVILYESPMLNEMKPYVLNRDEIKDKISKFGTAHGAPYWVFDTLKISDSRDYFFSVLTTNEKGRPFFSKSFGTYFKHWIETKDSESISNKK